MSDRNYTLKLPFLLLFILCQSIFAQAQSSQNMTLLGQWNQNPSGNIYYKDLWGYVDEENNEYAIISSLSGIHIIDVTIPNQPVLVEQFQTSNVSDIYDIKTYDRYIYALSDKGEGLQVWDMSALPDGSVLKIYQDKTTFTSAKNSFIDHSNARLYIAGTDTRADGLIIFDLSRPATPKSIANTSLSGGSVENLYVRDNIAYCSHGDSGIQIYDVTSPTAPYPIAHANTDGHNHACWLSDIGKFMVYAENTPAGQALGLVFVDEVGNGALPIISTFHAPLLAPTHTDNTPANIYIVGDYVFVAYHEDGVVIFDVSNFFNPTRVAYFDTSFNTSYHGALGCNEVYPFLPSGNILAIDTQSGLHIFSANINLNTTCNNRYQDGNETGADCGGYCKPCPLPTCDDGIQNGNETGIDCGGFCLPCELPTCDDGIQNGDEAGIDCGGSCPFCCSEGTPCDDGNPDTTNDVEDGLCNCLGQSSEPTNTCNDGIQNSNEAGIDCGGNFCSPCPVCTSNAVNSNNEYIDKVIFNGIDNQSGNNGGYADYTDLYTAVEPGKSYPISLFAGYSGTPSLVYWQVWIDLNFDGDFDDTDELLFEENGRSSVTGNVTIPQPQAGNFPIMRVQMQYLQYTNDACKNFYYGEVEDYLLALVSGPTRCNDGVQNGDETGVDCGGFLCDPCCPLSGTSCDDGNPATKNDIEDGNCNCIGTACPSKGTPCEDGNLDTPNDVTDDQCNCNGIACPSAGTPCDDGDSNTTNDVTDGLCGCLGRPLSQCNDDIQNGDETGVDCGGLCQACFYCDSYSSNSSFEYIKKVIFNEINHPSGDDNGYADNTNQFANVSQGITYQIHLTPGFSNGQAYREYWQVWIDYTQDGDFLDIGEKVYQGNGSTTLTGNITIPASVLTGQTRIRVQMNLDGYTSTGCDIYTHGEVEDYTLIINGENNLKINNINVENVKVIPNPFRNRLAIAYDINSEIPSKGMLHLYDIWGKKIKSQEFVPTRQGQLLFKWNDLHVGSYFVQIIIGNYSSVHKVIKM